MKLSIDVIIPTFGRPAAFAHLVETLMDKLGERDRVYVIWQGKDKPEIQNSKTVHCVRSSPPNLPKARNKGITEGSGDICLFLDDDVEILSADILETHRNAYRQEDIGAVAGFVEDCLFESKNDAPSRFDETTGELVQNFSHPKSQYVLSVMGAHMSFRRTALMAIGGFDENFKVNALWEEIDCAFRIRNASWKLYFCAEAKVRHLREKSGGCRGQKEKSARYLYHQFANTAYFAARHAMPRYYGSWIRFWKYRLEFLSRKRDSYHHDPLLVAAGILGACGGIVRYLKNGENKNIW